MLNILLIVFASYVPYKDFLHLQLWMSTCFCGCYYGLIDVILHRCHIPGWMWSRRSCWPWHAGCPPRPPPSPPWESLSQPNLNYHPAQKLSITNIILWLSKWWHNKKKKQILIFDNIGWCDICKRILAGVIFASEYWPMWYLQANIGHCDICKQNIGHCDICKQNIGQCDICKQSMWKVQWSLTLAPTTCDVHNSI